MADRIEPPRQADERATLVAFLDYHRATLLLKIEGVSDEAAREATVPPSDLSLLGLVRHLAEVERSWFRHRFAGDDVPPLFYGSSHATGDEDGDFHPGPDDTVAEALEAWRAEVAFANELIAAHSLDDISELPASDGHNNLRWVLVHLIEEYARHNGHADLIRERIDGTTGE